MCPEDDTGTVDMWKVNADTIAANSLKAQKFIEPLGKLCYHASEKRENWEINLHGIE